MSKLIAFGDSFTWGSDLPDETNTKNQTSMSFKSLESNRGHVNHFTTPYSKKNEYRQGIQCVYALQDSSNIEWGCDFNPKHSILTWPALLSFSLERDYVCYGIPGASNHSILREFFRRLNTINKDDIVVVNWSWIDRWDFYKEDVKNNWLTLRPSDPNGHVKIYNFYYKYMQSEHWNKLETLKNITLVLNTLKIMGIKYIVTVIDDLTMDTKYHCPPYIASMQNCIKNEITEFDGMNFLDWSKKNNYPISSGFHPLTEAHSNAFKYIKGMYDFT